MTHALTEARVKLLNPSSSTTLTPSAKPRMTAQVKAAKKDAREAEVSLL